MMFSNVGKKKVEESESESDWDSTSEKTDAKINNNRFFEQSPEPPGFSNSEDEDTPSVKNPRNENLNSNTGIKLTSSSSKENVFKQKNSAKQQMPTKKKIQASIKCSNTSKRSTPVNQEPSHSIPKQKEEEPSPPYDFKGALPDFTSHQESAVNLPGKKKKGTLYDPVPNKGEERIDGDKMEDQAERMHKEDIAVTIDTLPEKPFNLILQEDSKQEIPDNISIIEQDLECCLPIDTKIQKPDMYPFDQGNSRFLQSFEKRGGAFLPKYADRFEMLSQRMWEEFFTILRMILTVFITLLIAVIRFAFRDIINPIFYNVLKLSSDHILKPILSISFNGFVQPFLLFAWNIFTALRNATLPLAETLQNIAQVFAVVLRAFRLVEINQSSPIPRTINC